MVDVVNRDAIVLVVDSCLVAQCIFIFKLQSSTVFNAIPIIHIVSRVSPLQSPESCVPLYVCK